MAVVMLIVNSSVNAIISEPNLEELSKGNVVEAVRAVEDNALFGHRLSQVFGGLGFPGPGGALGGSSQVEVERSKQRSAIHNGSASGNEHLFFFVGIHILSFFREWC